MKAGKKYLRAPEIAALTGMSERTIRRWLADEILPSTKVRGARIVAMAHLEAVLSASHDTIRGISDDEDQYDEESRS